MENQPQLYMKFYRSNEIAELHQQSPVEEQLIERDSSNLQTTISQVQSLDVFMQPIPPIHSS